VNVEPIRQRVAEEGFGVRIDGSMTGFAGNTEGLVLGSGLLVGSREAPHLAFLNAAGDYARFGGEAQVQKSFAHARYNLQFLPWLWGELFGQVETDKFRQITLRTLAGTGPRFALLQEVHGDVFLGTAYMLEYTEIDDAAEDAGAQGLAHRSSSYLSMILRAEERVTLNNVIYFQPRWDDFSDYRILNVTGLGFTISKRLETRIDVTARYESVHAEAVKPFDLQVKNSIALTL
jgi:hypothetical protein